tara:strand:+ start:299 stop:820 length:522 start_codon:yes stop_codon:yes gene_type:complete
MKNLMLFTLLILFSLSAESQMMNRRQRIVDRPPMTPDQQKLPEFNVEKTVGMTFYNIEKLTKKVGVKKSSDTYKQVASIIKFFNKDMSQVKRINSFLMSEGKTKVELAQKETFESRDYSVLEKAYKEVSVSFEPIVKVVLEKEKDLDKKLEKILSEKQIKKWKKYKKKLKTKG